MIIIDSNPTLRFTLDVQIGVDADSIRQQKWLGTRDCIIGTAKLGPLPIGYFKLSHKDTTEQVVFKIGKLVLKINELGIGANHFDVYKDCVKLAGKINKQPRWIY